MADVVIYTSPACPYCVRAKQLLQRKNHPYTEIDISTAPHLRDEMTQKAGGRRTVPQIFIGDRHVGGFDDMNAMDREGKLDPLLSA